MKAGKYLNNGITYITLLATIVILLIITSTVIIASVNIISDTNAKDFAKELYTVSKKVEEYNFKNSKYPVSSQDITFTIPSGAESQFSSENITNNTVILRPIDYYEADIEDLKYGNSSKGQNDIYAVSETTGRVYYLNGYTVNNKVFYTFTQELGTLIGVKSLD